MFAPLIGHARIQEQLATLVHKGQVPPALLFAGPDGVGKRLCARIMAAALLAPPLSPQHRNALAGQHPDLHEYAPEGKIGLHSLDALRTLTADVYLTPYEARYKVFIVDAAERMLPYSANALLKTFEEPAPDTVIILVSSHPTLLLPTILSRCCTVPFGLLETREMVPWLCERFGCDVARATALADNAHGSLGQACRLATAEGGRPIAHLLPILAQGRFSSYAALAATARTLADQIDALGHTDAKRHRETIKSSPQELTALQRHTLERDAEGIAALNQASEALSLFEGIAAWYRDILVLHYRGPETTLWHRHHRASLTQALQRGELRDLDFVHACIDEASLALQRSNPLAHILETLFLRLRLL